MPGTIQFRPRDNYQEGGILSTAVAPGSSGVDYAARNPGTYVIERLRELENDPGANRGHDDWTAATALYTRFKNLFGREPSQSEVNSLVPYYLSNIATGNAFLEDYKYRQENTPEKLAERRRAELNEKAPQQYGAVNDSFQNLLKRGASQKELDYFGRLLASGELDPYELDQFVREMPEFREQSDRAFRENLNSELEGYDREAFGREKENVISRFAQAGRLNSPALDFALTDLMGKISSERRKYMTQVSADQYQGNKAVAREDYMTNLNRMFSDQDYDRSRKDQLEDIYRNRQNEVTDYLTQREDYMDALGRMKSARKSMFGNVLGGAAVGGSVGGPYGAVAGGLGAGLFSYFDQ